MSVLDESFDVIIAGGGTSGCVIAGRLSAADPSLRILVLEAGPPTRDDLEHLQPARYISHLLPESTTVKFNVGNRTDYLNGRSVIIPCGQCLGGGSSVNFMVYARAAASDYDDWKNVHGNFGWGADDVISLLKKSETYQIEAGKDNHGYSGPLKVSYGGAFTKIGKEFLEVAAKYDTTRSFTDDGNPVFGTPNAYAIDKDSGKRSDVAHHYIYNQNHNTNLCIETGCQVTRVIFKGTRAVGVEYAPNPRFNNVTQDSTRVAYARKIVVVSAGAFGSPAILERSGIGAPEILRQNAIPPLVDLPGVGNNYQDHLIIFPSYLAAEDSDTLDGIRRNDKAEVEKWSAEWVEKGTGLMAHSALDAGIKLRPSEQELKVIGPEFQKRWEDYYANAPDKPVLWFAPMAMYTGQQALPARKYFCHAIFIDYPASIGYVHITSGTDVNAPPDFDPAFMSRQEDVALLRWGYKLSREFARRMPSYQGELVSEHPVFAEDSKAVCSDTRRTVDISAPDIRYSPEDDKAIDQHLRQSVGTAWHSLGTCAMKPRDKGGVVDAQLNVYGVEGLKVADMSIAPSNLSANTYSTAVLIGEKAATIIADELKIIGV